MHAIKFLNVEFRSIDLLLVFDENSMEDTNCFGENYDELYCG